MSNSATPWMAACQASLSFTISWSLLQLMSIQSVMPSNHLILYCLLLLLLLIALAKRQHCKFGLLFCEMTYIYIYIYIYKFWHIDYLLVLFPLLPGYIQLEIRHGYISSISLLCVGTMSMHIPSLLNVLLAR